ncbi:GNAT family N-acetyltransferase [Paenibacillus sp. J5C_2022]|uniref:GNAT family N-acetyltransferase n=1 Tax=Paenibacillus sp. J5C2022 TaxID=2977129 RepID=UPI0021D24532|nr:GNAT family N-acetyltransferase [Paenibacillus sp. J5C2022]MCU6713188.1 GNAT family N-acetyltransferase [Paenibacillus sp. J5C2022]
MEIKILEVNKEELSEYAKIPMVFNVNSKYKLTKLNGGLGGILLNEVTVKEYFKDMGANERPDEWPLEFDISNWGFFIAYDDRKPVAGLTLVYNTEGVNMLGKRKDISVLWDIRVAPEYKGRGIGKLLISSAKVWSTERGCKQIKIETQNNNVAACKFYAQQGAELREIREYAYSGDFEDEAMLIWYLDLE